MPITLNSEMQTRYTKALARAHAQGLKIRAHVTGCYANGRSFERWYVENPTHNSAYFVTRVKSHLLECECEAGQHAEYCQHRALVREELMREYEKAQALSRKRLERDEEDDLQLIQSVLFT